MDIHAYNIHGHFEREMMKWIFIFTGYRVLFR